MFGFWILLSGYFDAFHIVTGILSSLFVAYISHDLLIGRDADFRVEAGRVLRFLRYLPWLIYEIFKANLDVAYRTLHPRAPIDPRVVKVNTNIKEELGLVTFANSITLTPGTVTIAVSGDGEFIVHAIGKKPAKSLLDGEMARRVKAIEGNDV
jgi:multicomponent Na+:H+ antiporter subunit E